MSNTPICRVRYRAANPFLKIPRRLSVLFFLALSWSQFSVSASQPSSQAMVCDCNDPYRTYTREPTEDVQALFKAAEEVDEANFSVLIARVPDVAEYAVKGRPLLNVLLSPAKNLLPPGESWMSTWDFPDAQKQKIKASHRASLPAKTRMLALALQHGASVSDVSYDARRPPLHSAMAWGNPEMVGLLLKHGAKPNQIGDEGQTALEAALDLDFARHAGFRPAFVTQEERAVMIGMLIKAGAERPFKAIDDMAKGTRPFADLKLWPAVAAMTRGEEVMRQFSSLGTRPALEDGNDQSLAMAARTGNLGGVRWLKRNMPRTTQVSTWGKKESLDLWTRAASWALYPHMRFGTSGASRNEVLEMLITKDASWLQANDLSSRAWDTMESTRISFPLAGNTLLHHLVHAGDGYWVKRVIDMGAPVDGTAYRNQTPLAQAVMDGNLDMARLLLSMGANPLGGDLKKSPLFEIVSPERPERELTQEEAARRAKIRQQMMELMLAALTPEQKAVLSQPENSPLEALLNNYRKTDGGLVRAMLASGLSVPALNSYAVVGAMRNSDATLIDSLLDHGLRLREEGGEGRSVLIEALFGHETLIPRLLDAGANPNMSDSQGMSAVARAVLRGNVIALDLMLAKGGRLDAAVKGSGGPTLNELAIRSKNEAMLERFGLQNADLSRFCFTGEWGLDGVVLDSSDQYWSWLLRRGFGKATGADCPRESIAERWVSGSLAYPNYEAGWSGERLAKRFADLAKRGPIPRQRGQALMESAVAQGRQDVVRGLRSIGLRPVAVAKGKMELSPLTGSERIAMSKLAGDYYLKSGREVGSQIRLNADGSFAFMLVYGGVDQAANGQWRLRGKEIRFQTPDEIEAVEWKPYRRVGRAVQVGRSSDSLAADSFRVQVLYSDRALSDVEVTAFGCQAPERVDGRINNGYWDGMIIGPVCQIVLRHPNIQRGHSYVYELPMVDRMSKGRSFVFEATPGKQDVVQPFNVQMKYESGQLIWLNQGRLWTYAKE